MEAEYGHLLGLLQSYLASGRLYMAEEEEALIEAGNQQLEVAARAFNIEDLPPALVSRDFLRGKAILKTAGLLAPHGKHHERQEHENR